ncbi:hypothetical protein [Nocardia vinacea]|nr:hypothetical protein [Nocardia vinacea]
MTACCREGLLDSERRLRADVRNRNRHICKKFDAERWWLSDLKRDSRSDA